MFDMPLRNAPNYRRGIVGEGSCRSICFYANTVAGLSAIYHNDKQIEGTFYAQEDTEVGFEWAFKVETYYPN